MKIIQLSTLILFLSILLNDVNADCGRIKVQSTTPLSESGLAYHGQFPWTASLFHITKGYQCGATIISQRYLLTAAHCVLNDVNDYYAILGRFDLSKSDETHWIRRNFSKIYIHENFNATAEKQKSDANIAVVRVSKDIEYSEFIQPACLPEVANYFYDDHHVDVSGIVAGYNKTEIDGNYQNTPNYVTLKLTDDLHCFTEDIFSGSFFWNIFCAQSNTTSPCQGDAGAGFYVRNETTNQNVIYGITLFNIGQCTVDDKVVFIDVPKYTSWIREIIDSKNVYDSCENVNCGDKGECKFDTTAECSCLPKFPGKYPDCIFKCSSHSECADNESCQDSKCQDLCSGVDICVDNANCKMINHKRICECDEGFEGDGFINCKFGSNQQSYANLLRSHVNFKLINGESCGTTNVIEGGRSKRIVNGNDAKLLEMPWAALLGYKSNTGDDTEEKIDWKCGGILINQRFVLTTAVCINHDLSIVRLGEHKLSTQQDCDDNNNCADPVQDIMIEEKIRHKKYNRRMKTNDIGLLKLATFADITKNNVRTICLPIDEENYLLNFKNTETILTIFGFGKSDITDTNIADVLQKGYVPYVEHDKCVEKFATFVNDIQIFPNQLCAGGKNGTDTCFGDSGSGITAIVTQNGQPKETLYGLSSFGLSCGSDFPSIYTNIHYYLHWILDNIS